jgi:hypothetical protein
MYLPRTRSSFTYSSLKQKFPEFLPRDSGINGSAPTPKRVGAFLLVQILSAANEILYTPACLVLSAEISATRLLVMQISIAVS